MSPETTRRLRQLVPWLIAAAILAILFKTVSLASLREVAQKVNLALWIPFLFLFVLAVLVTDSFATWTIYRRSLPDVPLPYVETLKMRGATYLLSIIHYGAGQGGMAYFLKSRYGVPLARAAGAVILTMGTNAITIATFALMGIVVGGAPASKQLLFAVLLIGAGVPIYLALIAWRPGFLERISLLRPLFDAGVSGHLVIGAARVPHFAVLVAGNIVAMRFFGIAVPITLAITLLPLVFIVSVLPISPSGLGTAQATAVLLFSRFAPGADAAARQAVVLGYSLGFAITGTLAQALIGLVFLRLESRTDTIDVRDGRPGV